MSPASIIVSEANISGARKWSPINKTGGGFLIPASLQRCVETDQQFLPMLKGKVDVGFNKM